MSKLSDEFSTNHSVEKASWVCREAIKGVGWNIEVLEPRRIVPKVEIGFTRNPSKIEVQLHEAESAVTLICLHGKIMGVGPLQKRHLTGELNRLRNAIEVVAHQSDRPPAHLV